MKILVYGSTPTSHFLVENFLKNKNVNHVYHVDADLNLHKPTNRYTPIAAGLLKHDREKVMLDSLDIPNLDFVITVQLGYQLWDEFQNKLKEKNIPFINPDKNIGILEWSKIYSKKIVKELGIPTPEYIVVNKEKLIENFSNFKRPFVIKYDQDYRLGMQTIIITDANWEEELKNFKEDESRFKNNFIRSLHDKNYNNQKFIVEEFIEGIKEYSYHAICNETGLEYLGSARDYKKMYNNDTGVLTEGMGCYAMTDVDPEVHNYANKVFNYLKLKGINYKGFMYLGIIVDKNNKPWVLEINTRLGEPEGISILSLIKNNLSEFLLNVSLDKEISKINFLNKKNVCIRLIDKNFPLKNYKYNFPKIKKIPKNIFCYKSKSLNPIVFSTTGQTYEECSDRLYKFLSTQQFGDLIYRDDIGYLK